MQPVLLFTHCPHCGQSAPPREPDVAPGNSFHCDACGFRYYFNAACAVFGLMRREDGRVLFLRRGKEPGAGKLGFPGGFVDIGETAEEALRREASEEAGLEVTGELQYLLSRPNPYHYRGVTYPVLDIAFAGQVEQGDTALRFQAGEVAGGEWLDPAGVEPDDIAFPSQREALRIYLTQRS